MIQIHWLVFLLLFQSLRLCKNNIFDIHDTTFSGLDALKRLDISSNLLTSAPSLANIRSTLQHLDLSRNMIISIDNSYFYLCNKISEINLGLNQIIDFPNMQAISNSIVRFSLEANNISLVNPMYDIYFPKLHAMQLAHNQIENYCFPPMRFAPRLSEVYLQYKKLSRIHFSHVKSHLNQAEIYLLGNPWHCDNSLGGTEQCIEEDQSHMYCMNWLVVQNMICISPQEAQGMTPKEAGEDIDGSVQARKLLQSYTKLMIYLGINSINRHAMFHYSDVIMSTTASLITSLTIVYSTIYSDADQRKYQSSASLAFVWGIQRGPVNSPHQWPVTRKMFPIDDDTCSMIKNILGLQLLTELN